MHPERTIVTRGLRLESVETIEIVGPFDCIDEQVSQLAKQIIDEGAKDVAFDLRKTSYLTSSGIATMIKVLKKIQQAQGTLSLIGATNDMLGLIKMARLDKYITIVNS
jgi:anti-anti-sigma factor